MKMKTKRIRLKNQYVSKHGQQRSKDEEEAEIKMKIKENTILRKMIDKDMELRKKRDETTAE